MLITLSRSTVICQSVAEDQLTGVAPLGAVSHRSNFILFFIFIYLFCMPGIMGISIFVSATPKTVISTQIFAFFIISTHKPPSKLLTIARGAFQSHRGSNYPSPTPQKVRISIVLSYFFTCSHPITPTHSNLISITCHHKSFCQLTGEF